MNNDIVLKSRTAAKLLRSLLLLIVMVWGSTSTALADGVVVKGNVYGGGNKASVQTDTEVNITGGNAEVQGSVYGGCNSEGTVSGNATVKITNGKIGDGSVDDGGAISYTNNAKANVHGGGYGESTIVAGDVIVNIGENAQSSGGATIWGDVYGGSAKGKVNGTSAVGNTNTTTVTLNYGTVNGDIYGGGLGEDKDGTENDFPANVYGAVTVTTKGGSAVNVFGCNNVLGAPQQNTVAVNIDGGTIGNVYGGGNQAAYAGSPTVKVTGGTVTKDVYGGGLSADVAGSVTVNIQGGIVTQDVYGGGALANTNTSNTTDTSVKTTKVFLLGGTINNNVYGGGLGEKNLVDGATADNPAYVNGDVKVYLNGMELADYNATNHSTMVTVVDADGDGTDDYYHTNDDAGCIVKGSIFGCNNLCGTPRGKVKVHVFKTKGDGESHKKSTDKNGGSYELVAVYGGGNMAAYEPTISGTETEADHAHTDVVIEGCDLTSIQYVYGGGNAASAPATNVTVNGSYEIGEVFGGGNGADNVPINYGGNTTQENPGANVGFKEYGAAWGTYTDPYGTKENRAQYYGYGLGKAQVNINGGLVHAVYGGSNSKGNVREVAIAMLDHVEKSCDFKVDEAYGGGKSANMDGKAILQLGCVPSITEVYGGARNADVNGDVELTITNGTYDRVFGGNNVGGTINGTITVNIEETGCEKIIIGQLFGGGNQAAYTAPDGKTGPVLNVRSFTSIGEIYGGGYSADVTGDVQVNINEVKGDKTNDESVYGGNTITLQEHEVVLPAHTKGVIGAIGNVYGGGFGANIIGDAEVNIGTEEKIKFVTTSTVLTKDSEDKYTVEGAKITGSVYGGGYGANTTVTGNVKVNVGGGDDGSFVGGTITIGGSVYGGSALGAVNASTTKNDAGDITAYNATEGATTAVTLKKGNVTRFVFGGGQGNTNKTAHVFGKSTVTLYGDVVAGGLYGGCDVNGEMHDGAELNLYGGTVGTILSATDEIPDMVFGGGLGQATKIDGDVTVNVGSSTYTGSTSVTIWGNVYGGGALGDVNTPKNASDISTYTTLVYLFKGTINGNVFGGGLGQAAKAAVGDEEDPEYQPAVSEVAAEVKGNAIVKLNENNGTCEVTGRIFGCNNTKGSPKGHVLVHVFKTVKTGNAKDPTNKTTLDERWSEDATYDLAAVYGGGNRADYDPSSETDYAEVIIDGCDETSIKEVYGGGYGAAVPATQVKIMGAYLINEVFGGGYGAGDNNPGANVGYYTYTDETNKTAYTVGDGKSQVKLYGGMVHTAYGGSNTKGNIRIGSSAGKATDIEVTCSLQVKNIYGAGKNADQDGGTDLVIGCIPGLKNVYGGAKDADIKGGVNLVITGGDFENVFGGNDTSGTIQGPIKVFIEESCDAINIQNLYLGGNLAAYSVYGYYKDTNGDLKPRKSKTDTAPDPNTTAPDATTGQYPDPQLYVTKFTKIDNVYGGGYGIGAVMYGNPTVNINEVKNLAGNLGEIGNVYGGGDAANVVGNTTVNIGTEKYAMLYNITADVTDVSGYYTRSTESPYVYTLVEPEAPATTVTAQANTDYYMPVLGANITGNVYGGGKLANVGYLADDTKENDPNSVYCNTFVNIGAQEVIENDAKVWKSVSQGTAGVTILGNVYGGGEGEANENTYKCDKAMVVGNTTVRIGNGTIGNGTVGGNVFGGGEIGRVERNSTVTIGFETGTSTPIIKGSVYGAGSGVTTHGYSALVRGNSEVTVQGNAKVGGSVYGGGETASVGRYKIATTQALATQYNVEVGEPYELISGGKSTVIIQGNAEIGPDDMVMPTFSGHVFGAGKGVLPYQNLGTEGAGRYYLDNDVIKWESYGESNETDYKKYMLTLALSDNTDVTIAGNAFVKGSVYGGSENGHVRTNTFVKIDGGQIGAGYNISTGKSLAPYTEGFIDPATTEATGTLATCASWPYDKATTGKPYDMYEGTEGYDSKGGADAAHANDGHTFYGNVFGGGSGYFPYAAGKWLDSAGSVGGNTVVRISDGHILSNVYGGNEQTNVEGNCTITMSGGTIGVPRTKTQIEDHPVIGNLFGAGKGDKRVLFNTWTNVASTSVNITGGIVYGSVFGGGEDGHVMGNATTLIEETNGKTITIGSTGESGADGNVFGGGRGSETALTAGVVGGNVRLTINSGTIKGSVYGGGRLASVGTNFVNPDDEDLYGKLQTSDADHGNITININDGTIGNTNSTGISGNIYGGSKGTTADFWLGIVRSTTINMTGGTAYASVYGGGELAQVVGSHTTGGQALGTEINISGGTIGTAKANLPEGTTYGATYGNVYGGGKGNTTHVEAGLIKTNTKVSISQASGKTTLVRHNIYGGGAYGSVGEFNYDGTTGMPTGRKENTTGGTAYITISGGTIGEDGHENGMIFGSSRGDVGAPSEIHDKLAWVYDTEVTVNDGQINGSIYGGGENGHVYHDAAVNVHGGTIGIIEEPDYAYRGNVYGGGCGTDKYYTNTTGVANPHDGNGNKYNPLAGIVYGDATVTIDGGHVVHNVYGAGAMGSVGTITNFNDLDDATKNYKHDDETTDDHKSLYNFGLSWPYEFTYGNTGLTKVIIKGNAVIGVDGSTGGHVYGAARGSVDVGETDITKQRYEEAKLANVREAQVVIGTEGGSSTTTMPTIHGSVYGGGEDGHVNQDASVTIHHGTIAHSVFGGGKGTSTYETTLLNPDSEGNPKSSAEPVHSWTAGKVYGNTTITMNGGSVGYSIYGGGNMASVGKGNYAGGSDDYSTVGYGELPPSDALALWSNTNFTGSGLATVNIYGGTVGVAGTVYEDLPTGNVFGSSRGVAALSCNYSPRYKYVPDFFLGYVNQTSVTIGKSDSETAPTIYGSVYGGGENGHVRRSTEVTINKGTIGVENDATANKLDRGNVFGAGSGVGKNSADAYNTSSGSVTCTTTVTVNNGTIYQNVYGGGAQGSVGPPPGGITADETNSESSAHKTYTKVEIKGGNIGSTNNAAGYGGNVYGACRGNASLNAAVYATDVWSTVNVTNGIINGSVFGGGESGIVKCGVDVSISGGEIKNDVYGGGALADTQTSNWDATKNEGVGGWTDESNTTTVNLLGGTIGGDAYGGGLGRLGDDPVEAKVYGDVAITLGDADKTNATAFNISNYTGDHADVIKSGRVFGCNNLNGSPKGNVTVTVYKTVSRNTDGSPKAKPAKDNNTYELAAVYGGGNLADYTPAGTDKKTIVRIMTCDVSVQEVYGGGNAAAVPETDVLVNGAYEIAQVFGGGNGEDAYYLNEEWHENPGANVGGDATTLLTGGYIHEAYGGSNSKGTITGNINISKGTGGECTLNVVELYGAGKDADVEGDLIMVMGCSDTRTERVYGCAKNANVKGNVELTITSGEYGKVFGGNNESGAIFGHIIINVEETGCTPIIIDELYGCGNDAAYSIYGYWQDGTIEGTDGKPKYVARTSAADEHIAVTFEGKPNTTPPYADPEVNIISCTRIGKVFGGGYGAGATVYGNPKVNINMMPGKYASDGQLGQVGCGYTDANKEAVEGGIFGGGNKARVEGNATVNIGNKVGEQVDIAILDANGNPVKDNDGNYTYTKSEETTVTGANIAGNVYGGGNLADITGNTFVNICAKYDNETEKYVSVSEGASKVTIGGNVFGGGKGLADNFLCDKAMVGEDGKGVDSDFNDDPNYLNGNTSVIIGNGTINGNVYGGGEIGRVEKNTTVTIGLGNGDASKTSAPIIRGDIFGGGKGDKEHGYAALVRGNPTVIVQGDAKVGHSVYGAGEIASVARYRVPKTPAEVSAAIAAGYTDAVLDMPYALANSNSGYCTVKVQGNAEIGPDNMKMVHPTITDGSDKPDDAGHVFAAGKGFLPENYPYDTEADGHMPKRMISDNGTDKWEWFHNKEDYIKFIQTQALASNTEVTIDGNAFVKGSVYGGSENGLVQYDTKVYIKGGQIGVGKNTTERYGNDVWGDNYTVPDGTDLECASWEYKAPFAPYDPYAEHYNSTDKKYYYDATYTESAEGGAVIATDGHTYYGNVFGGGSGSVPYFDTTEGRSKYLNSAGTVKGNTYVEISGGHILTSVYGGCEATNVMGKATVKMTDGTIGVPRTLNQIINHPVTCYLFGGGKGDQRIFFNKDTNVEDAEVQVSGGRIYGSVFGGGEDGHVLRDVTMTIGKDDHTGPTIGTWGTSYVDGNIFGGGRGFGGDAYTAGNVAGSVKMTINGGHMLGNIYGGGRLASVGYGLYLSTEDGYGKMREDTKKDDGTDGSSFFTNGRGHVDITINGGTIGNDLEYKYNPSDEDRAKMPYTEFDTDGRLKHTKGGNVFAGGMGRLYQLDGTTPITSVDWWKLGNVKQTKLTITGGTIKSCVYGGGELGAVNPYVNGETVQGGTTEIIIQNANNTIIGTEVKDGEDTKYTFGSVYGGGSGSTVEKLFATDDTSTDYDNPKFVAGLVHGNTKVDMQGGKVLASVYGGGEVASVNGSTDVAVSGGSVGKDKVGTTYFGGATMGNVYGGGSGHGNIVRAGRILKNTKVTISGADTKIYHNVYGGGAYGTVGDFNYTTSTEDGKVIGVNSLKTAETGKAEVIITGGTIGVDGHENGMVFGSSRGDVNKPGERDDHTAWVYDAFVTIGTQGSETGPAIKGSVYGSGENGHTFHDTDVKIHSGVIGVAEDASYLYRGNVYGGGCGTDKYYSTGTELFDGNGDKYNPLAGIVYGNTSITIDGGTVVHNVYGAGAMGSVGKTDTDGSTTGGKTTLNISGGTIGVSGTVSDGYVYGAARGDLSDHTAGLAEVQETEVNIKPNTIEGKPDVSIKGSVFGGGEAGVVLHDTDVKMQGGSVGIDLYGGGDLADVGGNSTVSLTGGVINGAAYGGARGTADVAPKVGGNATVELNKDVADTGVKGCVVNQIFGCNNMNGTPEGNVTVHVYKTQRAGESQIINSGAVTTAKVKGTQDDKGDFVLNSFDVAAVYGGGNQADYVPVNGEGVNHRTEVIIEGCDRTSIGNVYGGGNAAAVPGTLVLMKGTYEVGELFGGGNGVVEGTRANVGFDNNDPHTAYQYGDGKAEVQLMAGNVTYVYGGSNTRGDIRGGATVSNVTNEWEAGKTDCCETLNVKEIYAGGKNADMIGGAKIVMGCSNSNDWVDEIYAGAKSANVGGDVSLTITSGKYGRVFGGNKTSGNLNGSIEVNIEENGQCGVPVIIGELYGGGNNAGYSIYGYDGTTPRTKEQYEALTEAQKKAIGLEQPHNSPVVNVRAFTSIGNIFGGGYGEDAVLHGSPTLNINEVLNHKEGDAYSGNAYNGQTLYFVDGMLDVTRTEATSLPTDYRVEVPAHADGKIGVINNVFGGGNAAMVIGDTNVNIGTTATEPKVQLDATGNPVYTDAEKTIPKRDNLPVVGADIRGNVYGGGNAAEVTGNTNVVIGKDATTPSGSSTEP